MTDTLRRRDFLKASAAIAGAAAAGGFACVEIASAAPIEAPVVDKLAVRVLIDGSFDAFFRPGKVNGVSVSRRRGGGTIAAACTISGGSRCSWSRSARPSNATSCSTSAIRPRLCSTTSN